MPIALRRPVAKMTADFPTAPPAYGLEGPSAGSTVEKSLPASHTEIRTLPASCKNIKEVINTFSDVPFECDFETLRKHLITIPSTSSTVIRGELLKPQADEDGIKILSLLHETGFINPRVPDSTMPRGFRHINFQDDANFVKFSNWNGMQGAHWEIHPAFRTHLIGVKQAYLSRLVTGKPS